MRRWARIFGLLGVIWLIFTGLWVAATVGLERGIREGLTQLEGQGWDFGWQDMETEGYPGAVETRAKGLIAAHPVRGIHWDAGDTSLAVTSWRPWEMQVAAPDTHLLRFLRSDVGISARAVEARTILAPMSRFALDQAQVGLSDLATAMPRGWPSLSAVGLNAELWLREDGGYDFSFDLGGMVLTTPALETLPEGQLRLQGVARFSAPFDRDLLGQDAPRLTELNFEDSRLEIAEMSLTATGQITLDTSGQPVGSLQIEAVDWAGLIAAWNQLVNAPPGATEGLETSLSIMAALEPPRSDLSSVLTFQDGYMFFGPFPLGPAPVFAPR